MVENEEFNSEYEYFPEDLEPDQSPTVVSDDFQFVDAENAEEPDTNFEELMNESVTKYHQSNLSKPRLDSSKIKVVFYWGARGEGKTVAMGADAQWYYNQGLTVFWLWGARSNENVFVAVNRYCKIKWQKIIEKYDRMLAGATTNQRASAKYIKIQERLDELQERLHCNCWKAMPVNWLVPDYYDWHGISEYNNNWSGKEEYDIAYENQWLDSSIARRYEELSPVEKQLLHQRKLKKQKHLVPTDLIRICPFTIPNNAKNKEIFEKQFLKYALEARREHRWLIMNPLTFETAADKFNTISYILTRLKFWMDAYFQPNTPESVAKLRGVKEPIPPSEWTPQEKHWSKVVLVLSELRTIAPTNRYSPEVDSSKSKRAIVDIVPELRHVRCFFLGDLQSPEDLNDSVRPHANYVVIKNASADLLGKEWHFFLNKIEKLRKERLIFFSHGKYGDFRFAPQYFTNIIDKQLPRVEQLPRDKAYVVWPNGEFRLISFKAGGSYHHKQEHETIQSVTGITWTLNPEKAGQGLSDEITTTPSKSSKRVRNYEEQVVMKWCAREFIITKDWKRVLNNLQERTRAAKEEDRLPITGIENLNHKTLSNRIRSDKELRQHLNFVKNHKDISLEEKLAPLN